MCSHCAAEGWCCYHLRQKFFAWFPEEPRGQEMHVRCCRGHTAAGKAKGVTYWISVSHISSIADLPSPAHCSILLEPVKQSDPSAPVAVTSWPVCGQCHPQQCLTSSPDVPSTQGPKSSASLCLMTRWTGVRSGHSIIQSATPTHQY